MKKKKIILLGCILLVICLVTIVTSHVFMSKDVDSAQDTLKSKGLSMMLETGRNTGKYELVTRTSWPTEGYVFNETLSKCENGGTLEWDDVNKTVKVHTSVSDKCYVYFDVEPPDIYIATSNIPTTYGATGSVTCSSNGATYNQKYNRIEISSVSNKYEDCTLVYTESTSKTNLASYVISLAGTTQGTGQVVSETINVPDYNTASTLSSSSYNNVKTFQSSFLSGIPNNTVSNLYTFSNGVWTLDTSMLVSYWNTIVFNPSSSGYYQFCYEISSNSDDDDFVIQANDIAIFEIWGTDENTKKSFCVDLGYVSTSNYIRLDFRPPSSTSTTSTISFYVKKANTVNNVSAGIRYEGKNPNNYVWFNNELWRMIGVFDSGTHGVANKNLVKLIREKSIGSIVWNTSNTNDWSTSSLKKLLNGAYLNAQDGTNSGYCYGDSNTIQSNCDYTRTGINSKYRNMIENTTWYLGALLNYETADRSFGYERGTNVYGNNSTSSTGYIGLIYPSDYGYSVLSSSCDRTTTLDDYDTNVANCASQSWYYGAYSQTTITASIFSATSIYVFYERLSSTSVSNGRGVYPALYLKSDIYFTSGDGSMSNPYILGM